MARRWREPLRRALSILERLPGRMPREAALSEA